MVEEAKVDFFDVPLYGPTTEEVKQVIEEEGSFTLQTLKPFKVAWDANLPEDVDDSVVDSNMRGEFIAKFVRAALEPLLEAQFGKGIMDELFSRYAVKMAQLVGLETLEFTNLAMSMTKNP